MGSYQIDGIQIKGVAAAVPEREISVDEFNDRFGVDAVKKFKRMTGVERFRRAGSEQTTSDLCCAAAKELLKRLNWEAESIGALIFISQTPDYILPATACILQNRLGLGTGCIAFDVNLGCSGYVYGLHILSSIMKASGIKRGLLLCGDTSDYIDPEDRSVAMLFGDAGTATAVELAQGFEIKFLLQTDGAGFEYIIVPTGGARDRSKSLDRHSLHMDGQAVFDFTINDVAKTITSFIEQFGGDSGAYDGFILHQANMFILKNIADICNLPFDKFGVSIDQYGNTSSASIPLTLCKEYGGMEGRRLKLLLAGFGVGLSWGVASLELEADACFPVIVCDETAAGGV